MKRTILIFAIIIFYSICIFPQPVPGGGQGHGTNTNQLGGGAPIDGGLGILFILSICYSIKLKTTNDTIIKQMKKSQIGFFLQKRYSNLMTIYILNCFSYIYKNGIFFDGTFFKIY